MAVEKDIISNLSLTFSAKKKLMKYVHSGAQFYSSNIKSHLESCSIKPSLSTFIYPVSSKILTITRDTIILFTTKKNPANFLV